MDQVDHSQDQDQSLGGTCDEEVEGSHLAFHWVVDQRRDLVVRKDEEGMAYPCEDGTPGR